MCHTRELAYQIKNEYARFSKYMPEVKTAVFYGGTPMQKDIEILKNKETHPHIVVATPGRLNALVRDKNLRLGNTKVFVLDECDKMLDQIGMTYSAERCPARISYPYIYGLVADDSSQTCAETCRRSSAPLLPRSRS